MMRYLTLVLCFFVLHGRGQPPTDAIDFAVQKIRDNYAGYADKVVREADFNAHVQRVRGLGLRDTFEILSRITLYFRDQHLVLFDRLRPNDVDSQACKRELQLLQAYLRRLRGGDPREGYWINDLNNCVVGLRRSSNGGYQAVVVESKTRAQPGYTLMRLQPETDGRFLVDLSQERMRFRLFLYGGFEGQGRLLVDPYGRWRRLDRYTPGLLNRLTPFSYVNGISFPDSNTALIRLPAFGSRDVAVMDSLLQANAPGLARSRTWIIDLRNNSGGTISVYLPLLPFIASREIVHCSGYQKVGAELLESARAEVNAYEASGDSLRFAAARKEWLRLSGARGSMLYFPGDTLLVRDSIRAGPERVALLFNRRCLSAAELMVLDLAQSSKVTTFGMPTGGAIDYLDALPVDFAGRSYFLFLATTKRHLTNREPAYDRTGIPPDVNIPEGTEDWIGFVKAYYEKKH